MVTGCAGFIGSNFTNNLLNSNYLVVGIDSIDGLLYDKSTKIRRIKSLSRFPNFEFHQNEIIHPNTLSLIKDVDVIVNFAALPGQVLSWSETDKYLKANTQSMAYLLAAMKDNERKYKLIQASTSSVYGTHAWGAESQALNPISPYGISKLAAEQLIELASYDSQVEFQILRFFSVYGPDQRPDMAIQIFLEKIRRNREIVVFGDGKQIRDCTYVEDVVSGVKSAMQSTRVNQIYNIASGNPQTLNSILEYCFEITGKKVPVEYQNRIKGDQERTYGDISKIKSELNWEPKTNLKTGLLNQWNFLNR